ncbi:MAG: uroporphyrinogen decarboxylase family protein [Candidatus Brocadiia bacterium]
MGPSCERVFAALEGKRPDRVPLFELVIDPGVMDAIYPGCDYHQFVERFGLDVAGLNRSSWSRENLDFVDEARGLFRDPWGVVRALGPESSPYPVEAPIQSPRDLAAYTPPDPQAPDALGHLDEVVARWKGIKPILWIGRDAFFDPAHLRGVEQFLMDIHLHPRLVHELIEVAQSYDLPLLRRAVRAGVDIVVLGDDYADKNAPFMSPRHFEEFFLPGLRRAVDAAHEEGAYVVKHTDGNIMPILDRIVETGIDGLHPLEPAAGMSLAQVRQRYGNRLCLLGNVDCGPLLSWGTPDQVRAAVAQCLADGAREGAFLLSSSNSIHSSVQPCNYLALRDALFELGTYPLQL